MSRKDKYPSVVQRAGAEPDKYPSIVQRAGAEPDKFIDGETVSFDDEPTEVVRRDEPEQDAPTVAQEVPAELVSASLPVREDDPDDPHLADTVMDPPPNNAEASGEVESDRRDDTAGDRDVDLSIRLAADLDEDSVVETVTEVVTKPVDDLVIVFQDESTGEDSIDEDFDARETVQRRPRAEKQTVIGKRGTPRGKAQPAEEYGRQTETRAGHGRARTTRGQDDDSVAAPLPVSDPDEARPTARRTRKRKNAARAESVGEDEVTKVRK